MSKTSRTSTTSSGEGNTKLPHKARRWTFTLNNYNEEELNSLILSFKNYQYIIGKEVGDNGTPHLQGYIESKNQITFERMKKILPRAHIEQAIASKDDNIKYCSKENDFITNFKIKKEFEMVEMEPITLRGWQIDALKMIKPCKRTIHWIYDIKGNTGKSTFCRYILEEYKDVIYFSGGRESDIAYQVIESGFNPKMCLFDFTRNTDKQSISYSALETLKNGMVNTPKYKGGFKIFPNPHIVVCANFAPKLDALSADRWNILCLDNEQEN